MICAKNKTPLWKIPRRVMRCGQMVLLTYNTIPDKIRIRGGW